VPFLMILAFILNILIVANGEISWLYQMLLVAQIAFYGVSLLGWFLESKQIKIKIFFIPYYFCMMNYAVIRGIIRYSTGGQTGIWEKAKRK
jgi:biofilm PGA synthesis N-glycosyltransferase PgaC